ncbi:MAG: hypothetical protein ACXVCY_18850 [Pseudobdellovibrionaceae bacterium]
MLFSIGEGKNNRITKSFALSGALLLFCFIFHSNAFCSQNIKFTASEVISYERQAKEYLCRFQLCISNSVSVVYTSNTEYLGYYLPESKQILLNNKLNSIEQQLTLVHEFVHVFRKEQNPHELRWLEEGLAKFWEYKYSNVWPQSYNLRFSKNPIFFLSDDEAFYGRNGEGYISSFYFIMYLYRHFGGDFLIHKLMTSEKSGWNNILSSIHELINEKIITIPVEMITKEKILRHFAVALWMNDSYLAKYALFQMNENFEPLNKYSSYSALNPSIDGIRNNPTTDTLIIFTKDFTAAGTENYVIENYSPFKINKADANSLGKVFIHISY